MCGPALLSAQILITSHANCTQNWHFKVVTAILQNVVFKCTFNMLRTRKDFTCIDLMIWFNSDFGFWTWVGQILMQAHSLNGFVRGPSLIIMVRMPRSSEIKMSSHVAFVWTVLHFYHPHMESVWPNSSRTGLGLPVTLRALTYLLHKLDPQIYKPMTVYQSPGSYDHKKFAA